MFQIDLMHVMYSFDTPPATIAKMMSEVWRKKGQSDQFLTKTFKNAYVKHEGTEITNELMRLLRSTSASNTTYPLLGKNTTEKDLVEAMFALDRATTTVMDIERVTKT